MLLFPNCKINLGLYVTDKRADGFHNLQTVFYPINWCDIIELKTLAGSKGQMVLTTSGIPVHGDLEDNILSKTYRLLNSYQSLPSVQVHLHKIVPMGAGLGGGSADAVFFMNALIALAGWDSNLEQKMNWAAQLGSDCPFFVLNTPQLATGRGEILTPLKISLKDYAVLVVYPNIHSNTRDAFSGLIPKSAAIEWDKTITHSSIEHWKKELVNDFEATIFSAYPGIKQLKELLYKNGAIYASLSGSGSAVYGIFDQKRAISFPENYLWHWELPEHK